MNKRNLRLFRELEEIKKCPVPNISIAPVGEENLSEWHGNIVANNDSEHWHGIVVHFKVLFPQGYPEYPPKVYLCSFVPHYNLQPKHGMHEVCLDMLQIPAIGESTIAYQYWSSAFSIRSILVQMTSFILCDDQPLQTHLGGIIRTQQESTAFNCAECNHSHENPNPPLPTEMDILHAPLSYPTVEITDVHARKLQEKMFQRRCSTPSLTDASSSDMASTTAPINNKVCDLVMKESAVASKISSVENVPKVENINNVASDNATVKVSEEEWHVVESKYPKSSKKVYSNVPSLSNPTVTSKMSVSVLDQTVSNKGLTTNTYGDLLNAEAVISKVKCDGCKQMKTGDHFS
jgi:ubiquitin-protein ligase